MKIQFVQNFIDIIRGKRKLNSNFQFSRFKLLLSYFLYNDIITHIPCYTLRYLYLTKILKCKISKTAFIHMHCYITGGSTLEIGDDTVIGRYCWIAGNIKIGAHCSITAHTIIQSQSHDKNSNTFKAIDEPVVIEDYVWVGMRTTILYGACIKKGCIIGANSFVSCKTKMEECDILAGSPAKKISERDKEACQYMLDYHPILN